MKIGILTQPLHSNYGGLLQNYALQTILKRMGHEVITLEEKEQETTPLGMFLSIVKTFILKLFGKRKNIKVSFSQIMVVKKANQKKKYISRHTRKFIANYLTVSPKMPSVMATRMYVIKNKYEGLVVGSDQVWRPLYNERISRSFFDFAEGLKIKRVAYAASFGVDYWEYTPKQTDVCRKLVQQFDAVSVREESAIELCREYLGVEACHLLDPTMLLEKEDYIKVVKEQNEHKSKGNLFYYILDYEMSKKQIIDEVASIKGLTPFTSMPNACGNADNWDACTFPPVTQWLRGFMDAEFVVCDSFHGAVFSIIFNKPFIVIGNANRGLSRFYSLLKTYNLENRLLTDTFDLSIVNQPIDWKEVNTRRSVLKGDSISFLKSKLS